MVWLDRRKMKLLVDLQQGSLIAGGIIPYYIGDDALLERSSGDPHRGPLHGVNRHSTSLYADQFLGSFDDQWTICWTVG